MPTSHLMLALIVIIIWGINFLFVKLGLTEIPPFLLCAVRFMLASVPAIFFIERPSAPFRMIAMYGLLMFALQFALLFLGMHVGMTAGMASLLMQVQVFFSLFFAAVLLKEKPYLWQVIGAIISFMGIALVARHFDSHVSFWGFICILAAAATWGAGNLITKNLKNMNMMALVVWGSFIAFFPMALLSLIFEGPLQIVASYHRLTWMGASSVLYITYLSTWVGYGVWNWLLSRYPVGTIVPFTLLVPIVAVISSSLFLDEPFQSWKLFSGLLVIGGLCINLLGSRFVTFQHNARKSETF